MTTHKCQICGGPCDCPDYTPKDGCMSCGCDSLKQDTKPDVYDALLRYAEAVVSKKHGPGR